jgi:hypothetical protein
MHSNEWKRMILAEADWSKLQELFSDVLTLPKHEALDLLTDLLHSAPSNSFRNLVALSFLDLGDPAAVPILVNFIAEHRTKNIGTLLSALIPFDPREYLLTLVDAVCNTDQDGGYETIVKVIMIIDEFKGPVQSHIREQAIAKVQTYMQNDAFPIWKQDLLEGLLITISES